MRMLMLVSLPHDKFNVAVVNGSAAEKMKRILDDAKPEAAYFAEIDGRRTAVLVVEVGDASKIPAFAEPWFLTFGADVHFHPVMTKEDLGKAGLDALGRKWS
jgi:hypothetical protein